VPEVMDFMAEHMKEEGDSYVLSSISLLQDLLVLEKPEEDRVLWGYWTGVLTALTKLREDLVVSVAMSEDLQNEIRKRKEEKK